MKNNSFLSSIRMGPDRPDLPAARQSLYRTMHAVLANVPALSLFIAGGFVLIYLLGVTGLLDLNEPRLLIIAVIQIVASLLLLPLFGLLNREQLDRTAIGALIINCVAASSQVFFFKGVIWFPMGITLAIVILFTIQRGLGGKYRVLGLLFGIIILLLTYFADRFILFDRLDVASSLSLMAALSLYGMVIIAMGALVIINSQLTFRTISGRLSSTFTFIALLSLVATLFFAALANIYYDRQSTFVQLNATSKARSDQVTLALENLQKDSSATLSNPLITPFIQNLLNSAADSKTYSDALDQVQTYIFEQRAQSSKFQELFILDAKGKALASSVGENVGLDFSSYNFFQNAKIGINSSIETNFPASFDKASIILAKPFSTNSAFRGLFAVRVNLDSLKQILSLNSGIGKTAETYLVGLSNGKMIPLSNTLKDVASLNSRPAEQALMFQSDLGSGIWDNYSGIRVLGSYIRIPALKAVLIAEIQEQEVTQKTINITLTNAFIGLFTLLLTFTIVLITSQAVGRPIVELAEKATSLANGELSTRIRINREDEIGTLATSFNSMASELQNLVGSLENKVEDRTKELLKQTNYLRVASEVARDATTANNLDELLNHAAQLVLDRFGFYHTGIFLMEEHKEYAILRASPTTAGQEMLSRNHKLKVGVGIVGSVAASGESRIALDTGQDTAFFKNPLLPNTRSEVALPLKSADEVIGVLDVQSEQPEAFTQEDISILQIMADQLALAIQRVRLTQEQEDNFRQLESAYQRFTYTSWDKLSQDISFKQGYSYDGILLMPLKSMPSETRETLARGQSVISPSNKEGLPSSLAVPLKIRGQVIGVLKIQFNRQSIESETISLVEKTAEQLAVSLENTRLYTETQRAAERERTVSQITTKIRSTNDPAEMVKIALNELKQTLRVNNVRILPYTPPKNTEQN